MNLVKRDLSPFSKDMGQFLEQIFKVQPDSSFVDTGTWAPSVDIKEEKSSL